MPHFNPIIYAKEDGLEIPEVGSWALSKYNLVGRYCDVFTTSMRNKWENLVYIDLFSGSGLSKIKGTDQIVYGSPLIALSLPFKFTKYIFCEKDEQLFNSLKFRIERDFKGYDINVFLGDANIVVDGIVNNLPKFTRDNKGLSFAFIDPFSLNLHFNTVKKLSSKTRTDFLILLALHMDANRNFKSYFEEENHKIDLFLDNKNWRDGLTSTITNYEGMVRYLAKEYRKNMQDLGYQPTETFQQIRSDKKNLPLYYLAYFSKHALGNKFWKEIQRYSSNQTGLF